MARLFEFEDDGYGSRRIVAVTVSDPAIDWYKTMRDYLADASEMASRVEGTDSDAGGAIARLCAVVTHLLDENEDLKKRLAALEYGLEPE